MTINVQTSPDLITWTTVTPSNTLTLGTDPTTGDPLVEVEVLTQGAPKDFIRLNLVVP